MCDESIILHYADNEYWCFNKIIYCIDISVSNNNRVLQWVKPVEADFYEKYVMFWKDYTSNSKTPSI